MRSFLITIIVLSCTSAFAAEMMSLNCFWATEEKKVELQKIDMHSPGAYPVGTLDDYHVQLYSMSDDYFAIGLHAKQNVVSQGLLRDNDDMVSVAINKTHVIGEDFFQFTCSLAK